VGVLLPADVEQRAAVILQDLNDPAILCCRRHRDPQLGVLAHRHEFAPPHQHRRRPRLRAHGGARAERGPGGGVALPLRIDNHDDALGFADRPAGSLRPHGRTAEQHN
jgi:hypothetical protein